MKVTFQIENAAPVVIDGNPGDNLLDLCVVRFGAGGELLSKFLSLMY